MWILGQFREKLIVCQLPLNKSSNLKKSFYSCDAYCDYLPSSTVRFYSIDFQLDTDSPSKFCVFYRKSPIALFKDKYLKKMFLNRAYTRHL